MLPLQPSPAVPGRPPLAAIIISPHVCPTPCPPPCIWPAVGVQWRALPGPPVRGSTVVVNSHRLSTSLTFDCGSTSVSRPFDCVVTAFSTALSLHFRCPSTAFHCLSSVFPLPFHCFSAVFSLPSNCVFIALSLPFHHSTPCWTGSATPSRLASGSKARREYDMSLPPMGPMCSSYSHSS